MQFASRTANCAVGGAALPSCAFCASAQSPTAQIPGAAGTDRSGFTTMRPRSTCRPMRSTSAFGRVPIVQMTVADATNSPVASMTPRSPTQARLRAGPHAHTAGGERRVRGMAQPLRQLEQQARLVLQQRDAELVRGDARVIAADAR